MTYSIPFPSPVNRPQVLSRRVFWNTLALPIAMHSPVRAQDSNALKIFQSSLTGPLADLGVALNPKGQSQPFQPSMPRAA